MPCGPCGPTPPDALAVIDDDETAAATLVAEIVLPTLVDETATETDESLTTAATDCAAAVSDATLEADAVAVIGELVTVAVMLTL